jgi:DNA-binding NarL/FixJ family response regulator
VRLRSVLIVDDNPLIRKAICEAFTREGDFKICGEAHDGQDAIEKAQLLRPDLIVMDLSMPVLNGLEATRILKKLMPAVPVIVYSIHNTKILERDAAAAGAAAVVSKYDAVSVLIGKTRELIKQMAA